ncbi:MAG: TonB-dependent receptor domain-containing protein, partial [Vicinamibacteraceae bacterium]
VRDTSGAALPGATVTLVNVETGFTQTTLTNAVGSYTFANVLEGSYDVQVTLESFREFKRTGVPVSTGNVSRADAVLEIGQLTETVTVSSDAELLQTDTTDVRQEIKSEEITNIPLDNYRNYQSLLDLVPGTTPSRFQNAVVDTPSRALQTNSNGMNPNTNSTRVDGARNLYTWLPHHTLYVPSAETIESVNVSTASMGADAGMSGGASVTVVTKSGTNELKGSAYGRFNNEDLNASSYFTHDRSPTRHTIAAGALGGPLKRNTLFFFGAWEGQYQRNPSETFYDVPPLAMRNGDLSGALNDDGSRQLIYDPATGDEEGRGRLPFPNNVIPSERLNPIARRVQEFYPEPNWDEDSYVTTRTDRFDRDQLDLKINWNRSATHQIWGKLGATDAEVTERFKLGFEDGSTGDTRTYAASVGQTWTLGPTLVLDSTLGYSRLDQQVVPASYGENWGSEIFGIPGTNGDDVRYSGMPVIETGFHLIGVDENWMPLVRDDPTWTFSTNLTKSTATHNLKVGFRLDHLAMNHWQPEFGPPRGRINAANTLTSLRDGPQTPNRYNEYAAFLLGHVESFQKSVQWEEMTTREWQMGLFVSDRWNLGDRLTLNLGLRWEYYPLMTRQGRGVERLDFATMDMLLGGDGGHPTDLGIDVPLGLFSPNLGLAYRITENTVFRTGYGLNYDPLPFGRPLRGSFPLTIAYTTEQPNAWTHAGTIDEGIPTPPDPNLASGRVPVPGTVSIRTPDPENVDRGYIQSWNVSVERRLPWDTSLNLAYVGSKHTGGFADRELNWSPPGGGTEGRQLYEEFGRTASTDLWGSFTEYNYHSLQVAVNRRFTNGLHIRGAYTWSKAMNMTDEDGWAGLTWNSPAQ